MSSAFLASVRVLGWHSWPQPWLGRDTEVSHMDDRYSSVELNCCNIITHHVAVVYINCICWFQALCKNQD